ncbi:uncharacterized protein LOC114866222 [Betta splendens]|uniref:Uncharacterized protein LOC114866222 n=1 Tax=Betta splendens TaxID=158456 RepID=A0A6P7NV22_BETSP|nr:uncharacterized protein LOC114866222 [Betta splendens]
MGESQSRSVMLHHQDPPLNSAFGGVTNSKASASSLRNRKCHKDGNFNFLPGRDELGLPAHGGGDENRNPVRPRTLGPLGPLGRDPPASQLSSGFHNPGVLSPRSRLPCWSPLEPLPEIESGDDGYGRVPPDGAEERRLEEEEGATKAPSGEKRRSSLRGAEDEAELDDGDEWGDSGSESDFEARSGGSVSSLNMESGGEGVLAGGWDRVGVGEPKSSESPEPGERHQRRWLRASGLGNVLEEGAEEGGGEDGPDSDSDSDSDGELPPLMDAVWTLRDRERFKAQEMEKHQVQLTMYRRLALIRWVRALQARVQEQQNRLQSSFDVILTQRKELLRVGAAAAVGAAPAAAVGQS